MAFAWSACKAFPFLAVVVVLVVVLAAIAVTVAAEAEAVVAAHAQGLILRGHPRRSLVLFARPQPLLAARVVHAVAPHVEGEEREHLYQYWC